MVALMIVAGALNLGLVAISWKRHSVLACILGVVGGAVAFYAVVFAGVTLAIGTVLYVLGGLFERLLQDAR